MSDRNASRLSQPKPYTGSRSKLKILTIQLSGEESDITIGNYSSMTELLEQALAAIYQLPEKDQDALASLILEKIAAEGIGIAPSPTSEADIETLEQLYTLREKPEVLQFLENYSFLVPALLEAPDKIRQHFPDEQLFLQVVPDPEIIDYVHLVLSIVTERDPDDALSRLQKFDEDWLRPFPYTIKEHLITIAEFRDDG